MAGPKEANAELLASLPDTGPVVMVNMLRLRDREAYPRYSELTMPLIKARGGAVLWTGSGEDVAFGDPAADCWDDVVSVRYPSRAAFLHMIGSHEYAVANAHRAQAVARHVVLASSETYSKMVQQ
jgi:uncharacterized protein (DUF1330 family)